MILMKFGGTSVGSAEAMKRTMEIVRARVDERPVVVVSAMSKVTDMLYEIADLALSGAATALKEKVAALKQKHYEAIEALMGTDSYWAEEARSRVKAICQKIESSTDRVEIISRGEYLSSNVMYCAMNSHKLPTAFADAREFIITDNDRMQGEPDNAEIVRRAPKVIDAAFGKSIRGVLPQTVITQGFVGATSTGVETILGRGGSDYTASLIGMAVDARRIEIWTDVDGIRSADPRKVDHTLCIGRISFEEAAQMARSGAKVLHPKTIEPAVTKNIPVMVLNSMNPDGEGTTILAADLIEDGVRSVSSKEKIALVNVEVPALADSSAILTDLVRTLKAHRVNIDLINATADHIAFTTDSLDRFKQALAAFDASLNVTTDTTCAQISVIGKNISELRVALRNVSDLLLKSPLTQVSQNNTYVNISFVVPAGEVAAVVRQIHEYLFEK
ncbi:MAG: aspartate kinase [Bacteroidales bacterium]|nr:aspartate kinase [Bacteroidales bacterium]